MQSVMSVFRLALYSVCISSLFSATSFGQEASIPASSSSNIGPAENQAEHDQLRLVRDNLISAINAKDSKAVLEQMHPNVVLTAQDGKQLKVVRGREGVQEYLDRLLIGSKRGVDSLQLDVTVDELSSIYHDNTAIAFGSSLDHYRLVDGTEFDLKTRWSATLIKEQDRWLLANLQVSTNLFDNPVLAAFSRVAIWIAAGTAVAGLVLGYFAGRRLRAANSERGGK
jgi:ketosteroid isomerase-like protein